MKIQNAKVTMLIGAESTTIELIDRDANITFARVVLTPEQLSRALSRGAYTDCEIHVYGLDNIGKEMIHHSHEFKIPSDIIYKDNRSELLCEIIKETLPDGYKSDDYFNSQNTFFKKDGVQYARATIRKWVDKELSNAS